MPQPFQQLLIDRAVAEQLERDRQEQQRQDFMKPRDDQSSMPTVAISPERLATIGAAADIAGTYAGLKTTGRQESTLGLANMSPESVAAGLLGQLAAQKALTALVRKFNPRIADALAANIGANQMGMGSQWARILMNESAPESGDAAYNSAQLRARLEQQRRK